MQYRANRKNEKYTTIDRIAISLLSGLIGLITAFLIIFRSGSIVLDPGVLLISFVTMTVIGYFFGEKFLTKVIEWFRGR